MGYESRLYIVEKMENGTLDEKSGKRFASIIASVELCCCDGDTVEKFRNLPETESYIYVDGERCVEDKYGESLKECSIDEAIEIIQKGIVATNNYRRYIIAQHLLYGFKLANFNIDEIAVLHYGH